MARLTVNEEIFDRSVAHKIHLLRLAAGNAEQVVDQLNASDDDLYEAVRRHATTDGTLTESRVDRLLIAAQHIGHAVFDAVEEDLARDLKALAMYEVDFQHDLLSTVIPVPYHIARPKLALVRAVVDEQPMYGGLLSEWIEGLSYGRYTRIRQAIRMGAAAGETADQIIARIRGAPSLNFRDGALEQSRRSVRTTVITMHSHVATRAKYAVFGENEQMIEAVVWTAVLDNDTCDECAALDGQWWSAEDWYVIEESWQGAPLHPHCRCDPVFQITSWEDLDIDPSEVTPAIKQQLNGKRVQRQTYEQWLNRQSKALQEDILGPERARMFRLGLKLKQFRDGSGRRYTLPELRRIEAKTLAPKSKSRAREAFAKQVTRRRNYGWKPDLPDHRDKLFAIAHPEEIALPPRVSLRDQMPVVFDQGALGSCTANCLVAAMMYAHGRETPMLSRLDLYYKERVIEDSVNSDDGAMLRDGVKALTKWGVCEEATWPYIITRFRQPPPPAAAQEDDEWIATEYLRLRGHADFMKALAQGSPFVIGFSVYENFNDDLTTKGGILTMPKRNQALIGGHAILVVGYETDFYSTQVFKNSGLTKDDVPPLMYEIRNSFGPSWGVNGGYYYQPGSYLEDLNLSDDPWLIKT